MAITNAQIAQEISNLVDYWRTRDVEFAEWLSGAANGGPYGDGRFPLSDYLGNTQYLKSPAALNASVSGSAGSASQSAAEAAASVLAAIAARTGAETARDLALTYQTGAQEARDLSSQYADNAANSESIANTWRNQAAASAQAAADTLANLQTTLDAATDAAVAQATADAEGFAQNAASSAQAAATTLTNLNAILEGAVEAATSQAEMARDAALVSETNASISAGAAADYRDSASGFASDASGSAAAAAASAAAAATFNPALYIPKAGGTVTGVLTFTVGGEALKLRGTAAGTASSSWISFEDSAGVQQGYIGDASGNNGDIYLWSNNAARMATTNGMLILSNAGDLTHNGKIQSSGWTGNYYQGHAIQIGISGDSAYVHSYNPVNGSYPRLYLASSKVELTSNTYFYANGKNTIQTNDSYLRLNQDSHYSSGVYTPGQLRSDGVIYTPSGYFLTDNGTFRGQGFYWSSDTNYYIFNTSGYSYGSFRVGGARNGYTGIILNTGNNPTLMSSGGNTIGMYMQSAGYWVWYDSGSTFQVSNPIQTSGGYGYLRWGDTFGQGRVYSRNGGGAVGSQEGDVTIIW